MKKRRTGKDVESSVKSLKSKESAKGKPPSNTSKTGKSVSTDKSAHEPEHVVPMDDEEPNLNNVANDADGPQVDVIPKISNQDWFKPPPRPETPGPDWNIVKTIDDALEQSWFKEMIQAEKPLLMFDELMSTCKSCVKLEYNIEECYRDLTDQLNWINPEGHKSPVDMSKPLPLKDKEGRLTIPIEFFFNNDLEYLKAGNSERTYSSSITKTPVARYTMEGIEDLIPTLWSLVKIAYDKDAALGISHWGPQRQHVQIEKKSGYGYLEEIVVRRANQKLYKFKEGDFLDLYLNDIEDMLLLIAQNKLFNLEGDVIVDFVTSLKMFTRRIIVQNRVEDLQLAYTKKVLKRINMEKSHSLSTPIAVRSLDVEKYTFRPPKDDEDT
ncbi:hypothetical protein Tco_1003687 [Tanacetum coccineum]|uniref:Uncharacterized protein n=1 Tax=Tanacetum coccineum TaxID=301880 RepID=A0ABQ5FAX3_9ASTR